MDRLRLVDRSLPRLGMRRPALSPATARTLTRYVAPAVFLLAVTAAALVVRAALRSDESTKGTTGAVVVTRPKAAGQPRPAPAERYYVIRSGDTLGGIAVRFSTTVAALLRLNPGIEPTALIPGRQVRVK